jgi:hypothetical protein
MEDDQKKRRRPKKKMELKMEDDLNFF